MAGKARRGPLVVDANVLLAALLRDGTTRHLILFGGLDLHAPRVVWDELERNRDELLTRSGAPAEALDVLVRLLRDNIAEVREEVLDPNRREAERRVGRRDRLDAPYVAAVLALGGTLWSHDKRLAGKAGVPVVSTKELFAEHGEKD